VRDKRLAASQVLSASETGAVASAKTVVQTVVVARPGKFPSSTYHFSVTNHLGPHLLRYYCDYVAGVIGCCRIGKVCSGPPQGCTSSGYSPCPNDTFCCRKSNQSLVRILTPLDV
jgi:hypothetical protein